MSTPKLRFAYLDVARTVGALCVAAWHIRNGTRPDNFSIINLHYVVVDFFFILSGFVLFPRLQRFDNAQPGEPTHRWFLWHRFLRLWPFSVLVLVPAFILLVVIEMADPAKNAGWTETITDPKALAALIGAAGFGQIFWYRAFVLYVPLWSISALWWATVVSVLTPKSKRKQAVLLFLSVGTLLELVLVARNGAVIAESDNNIGLMAFLRALVGFNLGLLLRQHLVKANRLSPKVWGVVAVGSIAALSIADHYIHHRAVVLAPWLLIPLILWLAVLGTYKLDGRQIKICETIGKYAFPIFIWHWLFAKLYVALEGYIYLGKFGAPYSGSGQVLDMFQVKLLIIVAWTVGFSHISLKYLEPPIERAVERFGLKFFPFLRTTPPSQVL